MCVIDVVTESLHGVTRNKTPPSSMAQLRSLYVVQHRDGHFETYFIIYMYVQTAIDTLFHS